MTNQQVFNNGDVIERFNYINPLDFDNEYVGHLIQLNDVIYEVVCEQNGEILHPSENARIVSNGLTEIYDYCDYLHDKPLNISEPTIDEDKMKNKIYPYDEVDILDNGNVIFNGTVINIFDGTDMPDDFDFFEDID
jgi:hypothetical protein